MGYRFVRMIGSGLAEVTTPQGRTIRVAVPSGSNFRSGQAVTPTFDKCCQVTGLVLPTPSSNQLKPFKDVLMPRRVSVKKPSIPPPEVYIDALCAYYRILGFPSDINYDEIIDTHRDYLTTLVPKPLPFINYQNRGLHINDYTSDSAVIINVGNNGVATTGSGNILDSEGNVRWDSVLFSYTDWWGGLINYNGAYTHPVRRKGLGGPAINNLFADYKSHWNFGFTYSDFSQPDSAEMDDWLLGRNPFTAFNFPPLNTLPAINTLEDLRDYRLALESKPPTLKKLYVLTPYMYIANTFFDTEGRRFFNYLAMPHFDDILRLIYVCEQHPNLSFELNTVVTGWQNQSFARPLFDRVTKYYKPESYFKAINILMSEGVSRIPWFTLIVTHRSVKTLDGTDFMVNFFRGGDAVYMSDGGFTPYALSISKQCYYDPI